MHLEFSRRTLDDYIIVELLGELDLTSAPWLQEDLLAILVQQGNRIILDLSRLTFMDAAGLRVLLAVNRRAGLLGGSLSLVAPHGSVARILELTGLNQYFAVFPTIAKAIVAGHRARGPMQPPAGAGTPPQGTSREGLLSARHWVTTGSSALATPATTATTANASPSRRALRQSHPPHISTTPHDRGNAGVVFDLMFP